MPRYFLHVNNSIGFVEDEEGVELPDLDAAREKAAAGVRSMRDAWDAALAGIPLEEHARTHPDLGRALEIAA